MITKKMSVESIITHLHQPVNTQATAFAPSNIALAKYWGKRDQQLNLPMNASLSISLADKGATASIALIDSNEHQLTINHEPVSSETQHAQRLLDYLNLFHQGKHYYHLSLMVNIPFAAGLASSACIFAAIIKALNKLYNWQLHNQQLSTLARLGSGSASRSIYNGFVTWQMGTHKDGSDSFAMPIEKTMPDLRVGLLIFDASKKSVGSREGMQRTVDTSPLYNAWPSAADQAVKTLKSAIDHNDFELLGKTAENNALTMHATMLSAWPPLLYSNEQTLNTLKKIWQLRKEGLALYCTQDAGPNLKLLFQENDQSSIKAHFNEVEIIKPFSEEFTS